jgi:adenine-specific DNA-methyltransferase
MAKKIDSIKHNKETRVHIPSKEEAGYEDANEKVRSGKKILEIPKNPVVHRGQDPELFWLNKYGNDDRDDLLSIDIRSLYRHEHIAPEKLIKNLYRITETPSDQLDLFSINELFGNALEKDELEKVGEYYQHQDGWTNRLIQGDSHLVMASLLEREGMAGQVQTIYFDPPYGIKYGGNWQIKLNNRDVKDGNDEALTGEPEQIKAFRDTWELGIHSYLSYLRDRLLIAKELLTESGSCFVQISDENVHLVRSLMDEVFGSENFVSLITTKKSGGMSQDLINNISDYILWYTKDITHVKCRPLFIEKSLSEGSGARYNQVEEIDGKIRPITFEETINPKLLPKGAKVFLGGPLTSQTPSNTTVYEFELNGKKYHPKNRGWSTNVLGMSKLVQKKRIIQTKDFVNFKIYFDDFPVVNMSNLWTDTMGTAEQEKKYVVQTTRKVIERCLLMTTDPGDLVLDPTCGSGTTAFVAEQWGRRWITIDTSRIALNIAKQRLMTAVFPFYKLYDETNEDIRQGFIYKTVPHITLKSLANDEPPSTETLYDQPEIDKKKLRVSGPFTVETLQNFEPVSPEELDDEIRVNEEEGAFEEVIKQHLISAGVKNGRKDEHVIFTRIELLSHSYLHAEGFYQTAKGEAKAYFHIGPKFGTVSKKSVSEAVKECQSRGDAAWLIILGFSFESDIQGSSQTMSVGNFEVTKARIHDDLLQEGLKKKPAKSAASFVTIGEPDLILLDYKDIEGKNYAASKGIIIEDSASYGKPSFNVGQKVCVQINGLDIYDPIKDEVKPRNVSEIAYWMVDDDYDGSNFVVKQVFFCGGDKTEFDKWKRGLSDAAKQDTKKKVEKTLKIEIDDEAFDRLYGHISHPIEIKHPGQKIAVRMISQFGEESTKVMTLTK